MPLKRVEGSHHRRARARRTAAVGVQTHFIARQILAARPLALARSSRRAVGLSRRQRVKVSARAGEATHDR